MNIEQVRELCLSLPGTTESFPFDETTLVFKVGGKMYALAALDAIPLRLNLKCEPERASQLRTDWPQEILPAYHMNKKHWNTVLCEGLLPQSLLRELLLDSYHLVVEGLPKKIKSNFV